MDTFSLASPVFGTGGSSKSNSSKYNKSTDVLLLPKMTQDAKGATSQAGPQAPASILQGRRDTKGVESRNSHKTSVKRRLEDDLVVEADGKVESGAGVRNAGVKRKTERREGSGTEGPRRKKSRSGAH